MNKQTNRVSHDEGKPLRSAHIIRKFMIHRPQTADDMQISAGVNMKHDTVISNISIMDRERVRKTFINSFSTLNEQRQARRASEVCVSRSTSRCCPRSPRWVSTGSSCSWRLLLSPSRCPRSPSSLRHCSYCRREPPCSSSSPQNHWETRHCRKFPRSPS